MCPQADNGQDTGLRIFLPLGEFMLHVMYTGDAISLSSPSKLVAITAKW